MIMSLTEAHSLLPEFGRPHCLSLGLLAQSLFSYRFSTPKLFKFSKKTLIYIFFSTEIISMIMKNHFDEMELLFSLVKVKTPIDRKNIHDYTKATSTQHK